MAKPCQMFLCTTWRVRSTDFLNTWGGSTFYISGRLIVPAGKHGQVVQEYAYRKSETYRPFFDDVLEKLLKPKGQLLPLTDEVRQQWKPAGAGLSLASMEALIARYDKNPENLQLALDLGIQYSSQGLIEEAKKILERTVRLYDLKVVATSQDSRRIVLLSRVLLLLSRTQVGHPKEMIRLVRLAFFVYPVWNLGEQLCILVDPEKFDGGIDKTFRRDFVKVRMKKERDAWLASDESSRTALGSR